MKFKFHTSPPNRNLVTRMIFERTLFTTISKHNATMSSITKILSDSVEKPFLKYIRVYITKHL